MQLPASQYDPFIDISGLTHIYAGDSGALPFPALSDVSLTVKAGEYVALIGANGSGKTTLARHLNGLLLPSQGSVQVSGRDTRDPAHLRTIRSDVGMVFQSPEDQIVATIVEEDVAFGPENLGVPAGELAGRVRRALETVGMWEHRSRPPHLLSAGQQQRVAIAGALAMNPRCLVLDEATAMLDPAGRREMLSLLDELHGAGMTIVAITHHMAEAIRAKRVVVLNRGRIALDGSPQAIFSDPERLARLHLSLPPAAALAAKLRTLIPALPQGLLTPQALAQAIVPLISSTRPLPSIPAQPRERPPADRPLIEVQGLQHTYMAGTPLAHRALSGVDFALYPGEVVGLIGATGSGKSTLLQHLNGLLRPQIGNVRVAAHELGDSAVDLQAVRQAVGLVFQRAEDQLFERYVGDDVAYGPRLAGMSGEQLRERVRWAMEMVGLDFEGHKDRLTFALSGGERRKAALAGMVAMRPQVLALDEPTAGLDPAARDDVLSLLDGLRHDGHALVIATHNMDDLAALADRIYVLAEGTVVMQGPVREVLTQATRLREVGLDAPAAVEIAGALRSAGLPIPAHPLTLVELQASIELAIAENGEALLGGGGAV